MAKIKCINCSKYFEVDSWYLKEIEKGREEQICDKCKKDLTNGKN